MLKPLLSVLGLALLAASELQAQTYNQDLVAYYPFNNSVQDASSYEGTATATNVTFVQDRNGKAAASAYFGGTSRLEILDAPQLKLFRNLTISFWMKPESNTPMNLFSRTLYASATNTYYGMAYDLDLNLGGATAQGVSLWVNDTKDCVYNRNWTRFSDNQNRPNVWTLVTGVVSNGAAKLYINGALVKEANLKTDSISNCGLSNFIFGANWAEDTRNFKGAMDEIKIFKKGLSAVEVEDLYTNSDLVAYYPLEQDVLDMTVYANHGVATAPSFVFDDCLKKNVMSYDGTSTKLIVSDASQIDLFNKFTISMMVKPKAEKTMNIFSRTLYPTADNAYYGIAYAMKAPASNLYGQEFRYYHNDIGACRYAESWSQMSIGQNKAQIWYTLTIVYDGSTAYFYVNGILAGQKTFNVFGIKSCGLSDLIIGANWVGDPRYFYGYMSDIKIYERNLSAQEVSSMFNVCNVVTEVQDSNLPGNSFELLYSGNSVSGIKNPKQLSFRCIVYDMQGNKISEQETSDDVNFANLKSGIYLINVECDGQVLKYKIIK